MNSRTLAKTKNQNSTTFSPVFNKKLFIRTLTPEPANEARDVSNPEFGHNFGEVQVESQSFKQSCPLALSGLAHCPFGGACHTCPPRVQTKLKIGSPNDKYEQEADWVAEQVMRMQEPQVQRKACSSCNENDEEELIQAKPVAGRITPLVQRQVDEEEEEEDLQAKVVSGQTPGVAQDVQMNINDLRGTGKPLPESIRSFFEPRFGYDFSSVHIHSGAKASQLAGAVNARAFTVNKNVVFGNGEYAPQTAKGKRLMAHELTHVVQQAHGRGIEKNDSLYEIGAYMAVIERSLGLEETMQRKEGSWAISPDPSKEERAEALLDMILRQSGLGHLDEAAVGAIIEDIRRRSRGRYLRSLPQASKLRQALTKEALLSQRLIGRMIKNAGEDLVDINIVVVPIALVGAWLGFWDSEKEGMEEIKKLPRKGAEAGLEALYEGLPGLVPTTTTPGRFADLGPELSALESFPFPSSLSGNLEIPSIPKAKSHTIQTKLSIAPRKTFKPGETVKINLSAPKGSWLYVVVPSNPKAFFQKADDHLVEDKLFSSPVRNEWLIFAAPSKPGNYQVRLVDTNDVILKRVEFFVVVPPPSLLDKAEDFPPSTLPEGMKRA